MQGFCICCPVHDAMLTTVINSTSATADMLPASSWLQLICHTVNPLQQHQSAHAGGLEQGAQQRGLLHQPQPAHIVHSHCQAGRRQCSAHTLPRLPSDAAAAKLAVRRRGQNSRHCHHHASFQPGRGDAQHPEVRHASQAGRQAPSTNASCVPASMQASKFPFASWVIMPSMLCLPLLLTQQHMM